MGVWWVLSSKCEKDWVDKREPKKKKKLCQSFEPRFPLSLLLPCKAFGFRPNYK